MNTNFIKLAMITLLALFCFLLNAHGNQKLNGKPNKSDKHGKNIEEVNNYIYHRNKVKVINSRRVRTVNHLNKEHNTYLYRGNNYYYNNGCYYKFHKNKYVLINPPIGLKIMVLPVGYRRIFIRNIPHYYYMGVFYRSVGNEYETIVPPIGTIVPELPTDNVEEITIDGQRYFEYDNTLYKPINTSNGIQFEIVGKLEN
jgi:hypothetical protein